MILYGASHLLFSSTSLNRGASSLGLPYTLSRAPLRRRAPFPWLARNARSRLGTSIRFMRYLLMSREVRQCLDRKIGHSGNCRRRNDEVVGENREYDHLAISRLHETRQRSGV